MRAPSASFVTGPMRIFRRLGSTDTLVGETNALSTIVDVGAPPGISVQYFARMRHPCQESQPGPLSSPAIRSGATSIAATVTATDGTSCSDVRVEFSFTPQADVANVDVLRASVNNINQAVSIATVAATTGSGVHFGTTAVADQTYWYWIRRTTPCSAVLSSAETGWRASAFPQLQFTQSPAPVTACIGEVVTFSVATSRRVATYRWELNGTPIDPAVNPTASTPNLQVTVNSASQFGDYRCLVTTCATRVSSAAALSQGTACCDPIDFNNNGVFPEDQDLVDFLNVLAGGECP